MSLQSFERLITVLRTYPLVSHKNFKMAKLKKRRTEVNKIESDFMTGGGAFELICVDDKET